MSDLLLIAADAGTLTMLAARVDGVPGVRVIQERRRSVRRDRAQALPHTRDERSGRERRVPPMLRGTFALCETT